MYSLELKARDSVTTLLEERQTSPEIKVDNISVWGDMHCSFHLCDHVLHKNVKL